MLLLIPRTLPILFLFNASMNNVNSNETGLLNAVFRDCVRVCVLLRIDSHIRNLSLGS